MIRSVHMQAYKKMCIYIYVIYIYVELHVYVVVNSGVVLFLILPFSEPSLDKLGLVMGHQDLSLEFYVRPQSFNLYISEASLGLGPWVLGFCISLVAGIRESPFCKGFACWV